MKEWAEHYRPVRQRTVRSEATKDKAGALPPAVHEKAKSGTWSGVSFPDGCVRSSSASVSNEPELDDVMRPSTSSNYTAVTFVSDENIPQVLTSVNLSKSMNLIVTRTVTAMIQN